MMELAQVNGVWHCEGRALQGILSALANAVVLSLKDFEATVGVKQELLDVAADMIRDIRDSPIMPGVTPPSCSDTVLVTGVRTAKKTYLLRISPEGQRVLIGGLTAALQQIKDWEFETRVCHTRGEIEFLKTSLEMELR